MIVREEKMEGERKKERKRESVCVCERESVCVRERESTSILYCSHLGGVPGVRILNSSPNGFACIEMCV